MKQTLYDVLAIPEDADAQTIGLAYRSGLHALETEPKRESHGMDRRALLRHAYDTLSLPRLRRGYDVALRRYKISALPLRPGPSWKGAVLAVFIGLSIANAAWSYLSPNRNAPADKAAPMDSASVQDALSPETDASSGPQAVPGAGEVAVPQAMDPAPSTVIVLERPAPPARKPGFDIQYIVWSTYRIVGGPSQASGVQVSPDKIVTNCHVLAGNGGGLLAIHSATQDQVAMEKYARLDDEDVCVLQASGLPGLPATFGSPDALRRQDAIHAVGYPGERNGQLVWSTSSFIGLIDSDGRQVISTSSNCSPGLSGGPLFDNEGRLIGLTSAGSADRARCLSVTTDTIRQALGRTLFPLALAPLHTTPESSH